MKTHSKILLAALLPAVSAQRPNSYYDDLLGFGDAPPGTNASEIRDVSETALGFRTVPVQLGDRQFHFQTNLSAWQAPFLSNNSWQVYTEYSLHWDGGEDLNATVAAAEGLHDDQQPRLCASVPQGLFSAHVTNGYDVEDNGDCSGALGKKCTDAIKSAGFGGYDHGCDSPYIPDECDGKFPYYGFTFASVLNNDTTSSPARFAYYSQVGTYDEVNNDMDGPLARERERLHMFIFALKHSYVPVCLRLSDVKVSKGDVATAAGMRSFGLETWPGMLAVALLGVVFFLP